MIEGQGLGLVAISPGLVAVLIGWVMSVMLHELAHAGVAYVGGDRGIAQRGAFSNPLTFVDPITSLLLPAVILLIGGLPLPGGSVAVDRGALRGRVWHSAVAAAGPAANILLFLLLIVLIHPGTGIVRIGEPPVPGWAALAAALAVLQMLAVCINLLPVPPLDGYGIVEPWLPADLRVRLATPRAAWGGLALVVAVLLYAEPVVRGMFTITFRAAAWLGVPPELLADSYRRMLFGG